MTRGGYGVDDIDYTGDASTYLDEYETESATEYIDVVDFALSCPTDGWTYEGFLNGGEQFTLDVQCSWQGYDDPPAWWTAKFHLHDNGDGTASFGGMWIEGWPNSGISITGQAPGASDHLALVGAVTTYLTGNGLTLA
jgi:hypothetical protein